MDSIHFEIPYSELLPYFETKHTRMCDLVLKWCLERGISEIRLYRQISLPICAAVADELGMPGFYDAPKPNHYASLNAISESGCTDTEDNRFDRYAFVSQMAEQGKVLVFNSMCVSENPGL